MGGVRPGAVAGRHRYRSMASTRPICSQGSGSRRAPERAGVPRRSRGLRASTTRSSARTPRRTRSSGFRGRPTATTHSTTRCSAPSRPPRAPPVSAPTTTQALPPLFGADAAAPPPPHADDGAWVAAAAAADPAADTSLFDDAPGGVGAGATVRRAPIDRGPRRGARGVVAAVAALLVLGLGGVAYAVLATGDDGPGNPKVKVQGVSATASTRPASTSTSSTTSTTAATTTTLAPTTTAPPTTTPRARRHHTRGARRVTATTRRRRHRPPSLPHRRRPRPRIDDHNDRRGAAVNAYPVTAGASGVGGRAQRHMAETPRTGRRDLGHAVLPLALAGAAHHQHVAGSRGEVAGPGAAYAERADPERPPRAEGEDHDDGVVELAQLAVAVERDAVATVAVEVERERRRAALGSGRRARLAPRPAPGCGATSRTLA